MRLLITTQKIDIDDPILGFFHRWVVEFAKHFESVIVICLEEGRHELPVNVRVISLGKEKKSNKPVIPAKAGIQGQTTETESCNTLDSGFRRNDKTISRSFNRFRYAMRFISLIWNERNNYDLVFVHMNQEYVLIGGLKWRLWGKKTFIWRNHRTGGILTRLAVALSDKVLYTSPLSFTARFKKAVAMPVGIDTDLFHRKPEIVRKKNSVLCLGRLSPVKKIEIIIKAVARLKKDNIPVSLTLVGDPTPVDTEYFNGLKSLISDLGISNIVEFKPAVPNYEAVNYYNTHEVFVNATPSGSFDKTIFEAMACETVAIVANGSLKGAIDERFIFDGDGALAESLKSAFGSSDVQRAAVGRSMREFVVREHGLSSLTEKVRELAEHKA